MSVSAAPEGELVIQTIAMPKDTNIYGDIFGGWLVSQMDLGGSLLAYKYAQNRTTTVAIDRMVFLKPVKIGDRISCHANVLKTGRSSITISMQVWAIRFASGLLEQVTHGTFTFVAIDEDGRPKAVDWETRIRACQPPHNN